MFRGIFVLKSGHVRQQTTFLQSVDANKQRLRSHVVGYLSFPLHRCLKLRQLCSIEKLSG